MGSTRIICPNGHLGFAPLKPESFHLGVAAKPDFIAADSGSDDVGPVPLGTDTSTSPRQWQEHDLEEMLLASRKLGVPIRAIVGNVEDGTYILPLEAYNVVLVFNYLHRPLFKDIKDGVVPGGVVVYQTFTTEQARLGKPTNPDYLLKPDELKDHFADWEILAYRELVGPPRRGGADRAVASIVARKPS